ncbi:MAG: hypothetical protein ACJA2C_001255 [Marinoscillum sp.]|jgi:hypothetical protein
MYFMIGVMIYFFMDGESQPEIMDQIHSNAPGLIIGVVVLLMVVRYFISKQEKNED